MKKQKETKSPKRPPLTDRLGEVRELSDADFAAMRPASEFFTPKELAGLKRLRGQRGKQIAPVKVPTKLRIDKDVLSGFRAKGRGWQTLMNNALREYLEAHLSK